MYIHINKDLPMCSLILVTVRDPHSGTIPHINTKSRIYESTETPKIGTRT